MADLNCIKIENLFNISAKIQKNKKPVLEYKISCIPCFPENLECTYRNDLYKADEVKSFLEKLKENYCADRLRLTSLNIYKVEIKNIGNEILKGEDFFQNSKLRVNFCDLIAGFINSYYTKDYINAKILKYENYAYYIEFDSLKPNDSIVISFIADKIGYEPLIKVLGETKYFEKPINYEEMNFKNINKNIFNSIIVAIVYAIILIVLFAFLALAIYCKIENKAPVLKVQFKIEEVRKTNAK